MCPPYPCWPPMAHPEPQGDHRVPTLLAHSLGCLTCSIQFPCEVSMFSIHSTLCPQPWTPQVGWPPSSKDSWIWQGWAGEGWHRGRSCQKQEKGHKILWENKSPIPFTSPAIQEGKEDRSINHNKTRIKNYDLQLAPVMPCNNCG